VRLSCRWIRKSALEGRTDLSRHARRCSSCARFLAEWRETESILETAAKGRLTPPPELWGRIEQRLVADAWEDRVLAAPPAATRFLPAFGRGFLAAAASLLVAVGVWAGWRSTTVGADPELLARLDAFEVPVEGNPFEPGVSPTNPFFPEEAAVTGNPFKTGGVTR